MHDGTVHYTVAATAATENSNVLFTVLRYAVLLEAHTWVTHADGTSVETETKLLVRLPLLLLLCACSCAPRHMLLLSSCATWWCTGTTTVRCWAHHRSWP